MKRNQALKRKQKIYKYLDFAREQKKKLWNMKMKVGWFYGVLTLFGSFNAKLSHLDKSLYIWFGLVWFYGTSTIVSNLMPNSFLYI